MKKIIMMLVISLMICMCTTAFASSDQATLDDIINSQKETITQAEDYSTGKENTEAAEKNEEFIEGLMEAGNMAAADIPGANQVTEGVKVVAAWIFQVLAYAITALLAVRIVLDLAYIGLPFTRGFLTKGQMSGNAGMMGMGNMNGMSGMNSMNSMGSSLGGSENFGTMGGNMGGNMMTSGRSAGGITSGLVSNAAIAAVGAEESGGGAIKVYMKNMIVVLVMIPVMIVLAGTGALTQLGFIIGDALVDLIGALGNML